MTPTTRPKSQKPSTVLCYIYVAAVTVFLVVFVLECPLCNPTRVTFPFIFENRVLGILKPSFHMDHQVDIRLYLTEATTLHHYKEPISLKSSSCTCNPNSLLTSNTLRSISFHFNEPRPSILHWIQCLVSLNMKLHIVVTMYCMSQCFSQQRSNSLLGHYRVFTCSLGKKNKIH